MQEFPSLEPKIVVCDARAMKKAEPLYRRIRRLREAKEWSVYRLAKELKVSIPTVQQWELSKEEGGTAPRRHRMPELARLLGVPIGELEYGVENITDNSLGVSPDELDLLHIYRRLKNNNKAAAEAWKTEGFDKAELAEWKAQKSGPKSLGRFQDQAIPSGQLTSEPSGQQKKRGKS